MDKTTPDLESEKTRLRSLWYGKKAEKSFEEFWAWYEKQPKQCCYCGITEPELQKLIDSGQLTSKRLDTRGRHLEIERKDPDNGYDEFTNLALACYWCNNAKTDTFSAEEFKAVGQVFKQIWQERLGQR
jgi:5-methylcytosine-specific restriction endonuclease McrA